jgi:ankyrin repeat protein
MQLAIEDISLGIDKYQFTADNKLDEILIKLSDNMTQIQDLQMATTGLSEGLSGRTPPQKELYSTVTSSGTAPPSYRENDRMEDTASWISSTSDMQKPTGPLAIRAACYRKSCRPWCSCRCHVRRELRTPGLAKKFLGSLFLGYSGIPVLVEPCNEKQCRKRSTSRINLSYQFPSWFWSQSLVASFTTAQPTGPELLIRISNTIPFASETYQYCSSGNERGLVRLFAAGKASPFDLDPDGLSLLRNALKWDHFSLCRTLIAAGADLYQEDHSGFSAFHFAWDTILSDGLEPRFSSRKQALLELFPRDEGDLDNRMFGRVHKCVLGIIGTSLRDELDVSTAQIDTVDNLGRTPLYWAASRGDKDAVRVLLDFGAQCNTKKVAKGGSPLLAAAKTANEDIVRCLLEHGADIAVRCDESRTALHWASLVETGLACVKLLLAAGADPNCGDDENRTPLHFAAQNGCIDNVQRLLEAGAHIDGLCEDGWTPLACCVFWNMHESIKMLLGCGADTSIKTEPGESILHLAAQYADLPTLEILAQHELSPLLDAEAKTVAGMAAHRFAEEREESAAWNATFEHLLATVRMQRQPRHDEEELKLARQGQEKRRSGVRDRVEQMHNDASDSEDFEDAVETFGA